jgi:hypothetical protein
VALKQSMTARTTNVLGFLLLTVPCFSQDIEPRRWSHLPIGANFLGAAYAYTQGDLYLNPVLGIENGGYFKGKTLEDDAYLVGQGHLIYTFLPGLWLSASAGYGLGGESTINGIPTGDRKSNLGWGLSMGIPVNRDFGFKIAYIGTRTQEDTGSDTDTFTIGCSVMW